MVSGTTPIRTVSRLFLAVAAVLITSAAFAQTTSFPGELGPGDTKLGRYSSRVELFAPLQGEYLIKTASCEVGLEGGYTLKIYSFGIGGLMPRYTRQPAMAGRQKCQTWPKPRKLSCLTLPCRSCSG
jgi:hypothetical protein